MEALGAMKKSNRRISSVQLKRNIFIWGSLSPVLLLFFVFSLLPIFGSFYISLHDWNLVGAEKPFIGIQNYRNIIQDERFYIAVKNSAYYAVAYMVGVVILGLCLALLLHDIPRAPREFFRAIYFVPQVTSVVAISLIFRWLYQPQWGVLNYLFSFIGLGPFSYIKSSTEVMPSIIALGVWRSLGYSMVIYTSGLVAISPELREAAAIDGASRWQAFWRIILPLLQPTTLFMFVTTMIGGFQVFTEVWLMSRGGPGTASRTLVLEIYEQGFRFFEMGEASALAFFLLIIVGVIVYFQMRFTRDTYA
jgi:multiple sugar transport system permease protein